jgi:SAM-dependent methyltransferase
MAFLIGISVYTLFLIYSSLMGSPYVPSKQKEIEYILSQIKFKKNANFVDIGCGDGRIIRTAVKKYQVNGVGYDINPILINWAKVLTKISKLKNNIEFKITNILKESYKDAQYIYIFLMPELIVKLKKVFEHDLKKNTIIISHGFPVIGWEKKLFKKIDHSPFPTYYYKY